MRPVTICCVQAGNYQGRGSEYVNVLYDMVLRNMPENHPFRFVCFTDNPSGIDEDVEVRELPVAGLEGWWNKLSLFKQDVFPTGERIVFFDLDTLIINRLDDLIAYDGKFACLRDFYRPEGLGSGVMLWESGLWSQVWESWNAERPILPGGDQEWIERFGSSIDRLQDKFPGKIASYKADCNPFPPENISVVCFHGEPRPHNCLQKWVKDVWRVGGSSRLNLTVVPNTNNDEVIKNVIANEHVAPWLKKSPQHEEWAFICGSGPSLVETLPVIKAYRNNGKVFSLNNAAKVLFDNGIESDFQVLLDPRPENVEFVKDRYAKSYLIASQVSPSIFESLKGLEVYQWHPAIENIEKLFPLKTMTLIGGGITVGLSSMALVYAMGFRKIMLFGYDSSYRGDKSHAIPQSRTKAESWTFDATVNDRTFKTNAAMVKQAEQFPFLASALAESDCEIKVFGDGLLPYIAQLMSQPMSTT